MVEELQAGLNVAENIAAQGRQQRRWCMLPSVGTWMMPPVFKEAQEKPMSVAEPAVDEAELSMREAAFDFFWAQVDEEEEDERAFFMESELSLRQAALDFFWAQLDQEEDDERAFYMESELSLRQAAFDFFWAQLDQEEEDERALYMASEISLRQAAFDFFWAQVDQEDEDEKAFYIESELSLRQAAFAYFWAQTDEQGAEAEHSHMVQREHSTKIKTIPQTPDAILSGHQSVPQVWPTFSMAGSPAKSIRRAKGSTPFHIKEAPLALSMELSTSMQKSSHAKKRSSSTSALVLDLGQRSGHCVHQDLYSERAKSCLANKAQSFKGIEKTLVLPPLKKSSSLANFQSASGMQTSSSKMARGC